MTRHFGLTQINSRNLSSRTALGGDGGGRDVQSGSRGANAIQSAEPNSTFLPRASSPSNLSRVKPAPFIQDEFQPVDPLDSRPYLLQLAIDIAAVAVCLVFICAAAASLPLAIFMLLFASFD
ncbi:hypothetical protein QIH93_14940 [Bradyrhizobium ottawaense]|uniref:hypothetical protein n=1 Tax=Bradyrhizobium ottawaense TaxID=931866 RepID=UPI00271476D2|nr:hypothetical protein [Bradyrhizobium ottawaense]WLB49208.1 hypothetical protein QIH93_14940 [Bradyrhizobium ottawaense]